MTIAEVLTKLAVLRTNLSALNAGEAAIASPGLGEAVGRFVADIEAVERALNTLMPPPLEGPGHRGADHQFESSLPLTEPEPSAPIAPTGYAATHPMA